MQERDIAKHLSAYNEQNHLIGENLPEETQVFRVKVVTAFLRAAVPLSKMEHFREIFEESAYRLTDRRHMFDLVPFIQKQELAKLRKEIDGKEVSVIFDGTTYLGEALAIVIRYVTNDWVIQQKLVRLQIFAKSLNGEEVARELISVLSVSYGIPSYSLLAAMRDRASVNEVAIKTLKIVYPNLVSVGCFSHTTDHVGEKFCTPTLTEFIVSWTSLFSHSPKGRMLWKEQTGRSMGNFSATRWWSRWEIMDQILVQFGDIEAFLRKEDVGSNATHLKLLGFLTDVEKKAKLQLELAAVIDWGHPFVKATYRLEGDGPLAVDCYETIETVRAAIGSSHTPNVQAIIQKVSSSSDSILLHNVFCVSPKVHSRDARGKAGSSNSGGSLQQEMLQHTKACVQPGLDYFEKHLSSSLKDVLLAFKAARFFSPQKMRDIQPDADVIDTLKTFPFLNSPTNLNELKEELPMYLAKVTDLNPKIECLDWWKENEHSLPCWAHAARKIFLV